MQVYVLVLEKGSKEENMTTLDTDSSQKYPTQVAPNRSGPRALLILSLYLSRTHVTATLFNYLLFLYGKEN